ncbi:hypothetical protein B0H19DRAFT_860252, partial [Mycena capillaripes]
WLKSYLRFGPDRPLWAFAADELQALNISAKYNDKVDKQLRLNAFLQSWSSKRAALLQDLNNMMKVALKRDVQMEGLAFTRETIRGLTIWYHFKSHATKRLFNRTLCLKSKHKVKTVGETEELARRLQTPGHRNRRNCACPGCIKTRTECNNSCESPHLCYIKARSLLASLPDKWNPLTPQPEDYEVDDSNNWNEPLNEREVKFNPVVTTEGGLTGSFRIFCDGQRSSNTAPNTRFEPEPDEEKIIAYTDGSAINNGKEDAQAGAGIYYGPGDGQNKMIRVPTELLPSNNVGEILA